MESARKLTRKEKAEKSRKSPSGMIGDKKILERKKKLMYFLGLIAAAFGFLLYIQTVGYSYVLDDHIAINDNAFIRQGLRGIGSILTTPYHYGNWFSEDDLYRPLSLVMFAVEWQFFPNTPAIGHFINVLLYAITGLLLFKLLSRIFTGNVWIPFAATMLFMAHPVHTEVVANIKSRDEILSFLLSVTCIYWLLDYIQTSNRKKLAASCISFFLALTAKESAITLLVIIPMLLYVFKDIPVRKAMVKMIPFFILAVVYIVIRATILNGIYQTKEVSLYDNVLVIAPDFLSRTATALYVLGRYLLLLVLPVHLSMDYSYSEINIFQFSDYRVIGSFVIYLLLATYAIIKIKKKEVIAFSILFYLVTIFFVSNLVIMIGTVMGDRLLYMPSLGYCLLLAVLIARIVKTDSSENTALNLTEFIKANGKPILILSVVLLLYSFKTITRNPVWKNDLTLHQSGVQTSPKSSRNHHNLATQILNSFALVEKDSRKRDSIYKVCISGYQQSAFLYPENYEAYRDMGYVYQQMNDYTNAYLCYDKALKINPRDAKTLGNKGALLFNEQKYEEAINLLNQALHWSPGNVVALKNLGNCYGAMNDLDQALFYFKKCLEYPMDDAGKIGVYRKISQVYSMLGNEALVNSYSEKANELEAQVNR